MQRNIIVLITGMPASGKTTLGKHLSEKYHFPFISKDTLKECMFNALGWNDKQWSLKVSAASHRIMDYFVEEELKAGHSVIVESNFKHEIDSERFARIQAKYDCILIQVLCWAEGEVLFNRFRGRIDTEKRHEGHVEIPLAQIKKDFIGANGRDKPLDINGDTIELDTTCLELIDYGKVYQAIDQLIPVL